MAVDINWSGGVECQYNEPECANYESPIDVDVVVEHHLFKSEVNVEVNESYDDEDLQTAYLDSHFTPIELLKELEKYIEHEISVMDKVACSSRYSQLKRMLKDCKGWEDEEMIIYEQ